MITRARARVCVYYIRTYIKHLLKFYMVLTSNHQNTGRDYLKDISVKVPKMKAPKSRDSLSWGMKRRSELIANQDARLVSDAVSSINRFSNDGSFMREILEKQNDNSRSPVRENAKSEPESLLPVNEQLSANQLAAKALQLRLKGKHEEAEKLMVRLIRIVFSFTDRKTTNAC